MRQIAVHIQLPAVRLILGYIVRLRAGPVFHDSNAAPGAHIDLNVCQRMVDVKHVARFLDVEDGAPSRVGNFPLLALHDNRHKSADVMIIHVFFIVREVDAFIRE